MICDTGASCHLVAARNQYMYNIKPANIQLHVGGGGQVLCKYTCSLDLSVEQKPTAKLTLDKLRYFDVFGPNILSVGLLAQSGLLIQIRGDKLDVCLPDGKTILFTAHKRMDCCLYEVRLVPCAPPLHADTSFPVDDVCQVIVPGTSSNRHVPADPVAEGIIMPDAFQGMPDLGASSDEDSDEEGDWLLVLLIQVLPVRGIPALLAMTQVSH